MSQHEDLQKNPLFQMFLDSELYAQAAKKQLIVCVPAAESLKLTKLTKDIMLSHVISASPFGKDEFITQNGKTLTMKENKISVGKGFADTRSVAVQHNELYYDDSFESFKVMVLPFPLVGKVSLDYFKSVTNTGVLSTPVEKRTLEEHREVIEKLIGAGSPGFNPAAFQTATTVTASGAPLLPHDIAMQGIHRFVTTFNSSYVIVKGFIAHAGTKVRDTCVHIRDEATAKLKSKPITSLRVSEGGVYVAAPLAAFAASELLAAIETTVMAAISKKIFAGLSELFALEEKKLGEMLGRMAKVPMTAIGVRPEVVCNPARAVRRMGTLNNVHTPFQKLCLLAEVQQLVIDAVDQQCTNSGGDEKDAKEGETKKKDAAVLTTDDLLPMMVFVIIHAGAENLHANLEYLTHFHCRAPELNIAHLNAHLANFHGALEYIASGKLLKPRSESDADDGSEHSDEDAEADSGAGHRRAQSSGAGLLARGVKSITLEDHSGGGGSGGAGHHARSQSLSMGGARGGGVAAPLAMPVSAPRGSVSRPGSSLSVRSDLTVPAAEPGPGSGSTSPLSRSPKSSVRTSLRRPSRNPEGSSSSSGSSGGGSGAPAKMTSAAAAALVGTSGRGSTSASQPPPASRSQSMVGGFSARPGSASQSGSSSGGSDRDRGSYSSARRGDRDGFPQSASDEDLRQQLFGGSRGGSGSAASSGAGSRIGAGASGARSSGRLPAHPQRIEEDSPKYKEADLGDFLLRLQNSGDGVSGKLREFKRS